jgi:hypothetical protein
LRTADENDVLMLVGDGSNQPRSDKLGIIPVEEPGLQPPWPEVKWVDSDDSETNGRPEDQRK